MTPRRFQIAAAGLAIGGIGWGVLLFPWLRLDNPDGLLILGPGYVITLGYVIRAVIKPNRFICKFIWGASAVVQGLWFILVGVPVFFSL